MGRATRRHRLGGLLQAQISIHTLRGEGDAKAAAEWATGRNFNPHPPWGGRQNSESPFTGTFYFNPHPPWGGRHNRYLAERAELLISIHTLRGEGDPRDEKRIHRPEYFNPHPPWGGRRTRWSNSFNYNGFQSTPSVGRATKGTREK